MGTDPLQNVVADHGTISITFQEQEHEVLVAI